MKTVDNIPHSDTELGVTVDDLRVAAQMKLPPKQWENVRREARKLAVARNRIASRRGDMFGMSAGHRPLFED